MHEVMIDNYEIHTTRNRDGKTTHQVKEAHSVLGSDIHCSKLQPFGFGMLHHIKSPAPKDIFRTNCSKV